jgi:hypothetical protein
MNLIQGDYLEVPLSGNLQLKSLSGSKLPHAKNIYCQAEKCCQETGIFPRWHLKVMKKEMINVLYVRLGLHIVVVFYSFTLTLQ